MKHNTVQDLLVSNILKQQIFDSFLSFLPTVVILSPNSSYLFECNTWMFSSLIHTCSLISPIIQNVYLTLTEEQYGCLSHRSLVFTYCKPKGPQMYFHITTQQSLKRSRPSCLPSNVLRNLVDWNLSQHKNTSSSLDDTYCKALHNSQQHSRYS